MPTLKQLSKRNRVRKFHKSRAKSLDKCPQKRGICAKIFTVKPKKPNSAMRKVARVRLSNKKMVSVAIPGQGHNLTQYCVILVLGGRANDLPGVRYKAMKGLKDFSWKEDFIRTQSRSKYGIPKSIKR